jgi:hypothetical protein
MAVISCLLSSDSQRGRSRPLNLLYWINRASRTCKKSGSPEGAPACRLLAIASGIVAHSRNASISWGGALLFHLEHVDGEIARFKLAIPVSPNAIHLIALDTDDGHQWPSRTQPNKIATP